MDWADKKWGAVADQVYGLSLQDPTVDASHAGESVHHRGERDVGDVVGEFARCGGGVSKGTHTVAETNVRETIIEEWYTHNWDPSLDRCVDIGP